MIQSANLPLFLIPLLWGLDVLSTFLFMSSYKRKYPEDDNWRNMEANFIARFLWKKFGLEKGMIIAMLITLPIIVFSSILASTSLFYFGVIIGMYFVTFIEHFHAIRFVAKDINSKVVTNRNI